jgi:hypothetical protein
MSKKMKAYEIRYRPDNAGTSDADMKNVVLVSVSKSQAIIDLVNEDNPAWIGSIRKLAEFDTRGRWNYGYSYGSTKFYFENNMTNEEKSNTNRLALIWLKESQEVIEGLLEVLSRFEYLSNQYKQCLPAIEKAKKFLNGEEV